MKLKKSNNYLCDTETGGLKSYVNGLCSLYITKYGSVFEERFFFYPQNKIYDFAALDINGFTFSDLFDKGSSRDKFIKSFDNICSNHLRDEGFVTFVGWNGGFDLDFISQVYKDKGQKFKCPILNLDLLEIYKKNIPKVDKRKKEQIGVEDYKLTTVYQYFFSDFREELAHSDIYDVYMLQKLFELAVQNKWIEFEE